MKARAGTRRLALTVAVWIALVAPGVDLRAGGQAASCSILQVPSVAFASYDVISAVANDVQSQIRILCDPNVGTLRVHLSQGLSNAFSARTMSAGTTDRLRYNIYTDEQRTKIWGDGSAGTSYYVKYRPVLEVVTLYGRITAKQTVKVGVYGDTLKLTILY